MSLILKLRKNLLKLSVHEPIIERIVFETVQKSFIKTKYRKPKIAEKNMFSGLLKCSDCSANLNFKLHQNPINNFFSCHNKRQQNGLCNKTHHIRVDMLTQNIESRILSITQFSRKFEDEFLKIVMNENYKQIEAEQHINQEKLNMALKRNVELDNICEKLYEDKVKGILTEERFLKHSTKFEDEQIELKEEIKQLNKIVNQEKSHEMNINNFLKLVKKYEDVKELNFEILHEFIDRITIHHREIIDEARIQKIEVYYRFIGKIEIPNMKDSELLIHENIFGKQGGFIGNENASKENL